MTQTSIQVAKATLSLLLLLCVPFSFMAAQTIVGSVVYQSTDSPLPGATVSASGTTTTTDAFGSFELKIVATAGSSILLTINKDGFLNYQQDIAIDGSPRINLGTIKLPSSGSFDPTVTDEFIPTISLSNDEVGGGGVQSVSGVLSASNDAFVSAAAFVFGPARFNIRGYNAQYTTVLINGMPVNDLENEGVFFNHWGGLNDVFRNRTNIIGLGASTFAYGGVGGSSNIDTRASSQRKQLRVGYALANRTYRNRLMATYSTGMMESGWAISASASRRWADEGYIEGTFYDAYSYFLSVDRKLGKNATLNLTTFGAPVKRGKTSGATQEVYDLHGNNYYNANWGYQEGEKRNARVFNAHQPMFILRKDWAISDKFQWTTSLGYQTGRTGNSALDWYDAPDPRPNYYRYLPSYFDEESADQIAAQWPAAGQLNWDQMYQINYNSLESIPNANGIEGNTVTGLRSQYIIEDRRTDLRRANANTVLEAFLTDNITLQFGLTYQAQLTQNYKLVDDLLGGEFYLNVDKFAEFDSTGIFTENNLDVPNQILREGDVFGYDFDYQMRQAGGWAQANFKYRKLDMFVAANAGQAKFWRKGNVANGKFPNESFGDSERPKFAEYGAKGGITYKLNGRNYLLANAAYQTQAPNVRDGFASPRSRNEIVENLTQEKITSFEGGYLLRAPRIRARAMGYFTRFEDQVFNRSFFFDGAIRTDDGLRGGFVNYIMTGINTQHAGLELGVEANVTSTLRVSAVAALGQYIYTSRPTASVYLDQLADKVVEHTVYINEFFVPSSPNEAFTVGLSYNSPKFWFASFNFNYFGGTYLDFYPERRTTEAISYVPNPQVQQEIVTPDSPLWNSIIHQERTPAAFTIDFFGGKSWKLKNHFIYLNVGVSNLLDNQDFQTGGFEQFRFDFEGKDVNRFPNQYFYSFGRTYFINVSYKI